MDIELAFTSMLNAITLKSSQNLADGSIKMWNIVKEKSDYDKERIIIKYIDVITKAWKYIDENGNDKLKSIIKSVFKPLIQPFRTIEKWLENYTSDYFLKFIQGITLFHDHNLDNINDLFRKKRNCLSFYLERKIYDDMYRTILNIFEKNFGHKLDNFESVFSLPNFNFIQVKVLWTDDLIPIGLEFKYNLIDRIFIEKYNKTFDQGSYFSDVSCIRITKEDNNIISQHFTQSILKQKIQWDFLEIDVGSANSIFKNNLQDMMKSAREKHIRVPIL